MTTAKLILKNAGFDIGESLVIGGVPKPNAKRFNVNIGHSETDIALHIDVRFNCLGHVKKVAFNSRQGCVWGEEVVVDKFPFNRGEKFKMDIKFSRAEFLVILPDDSTIPFPNRLGAELYSFIFVDHDLRITSIEIK